MKVDGDDAFFANRGCRYYPCHRDAEGMDCKFCFCPLYFLVRCPGKPVWRDDGIKDCSLCAWPHDPANMPELLRLLRKAVDAWAEAKRKAEARKEAKRWK